MTVFWLTLLLISFSSRAFAHSHAARPPASLDVLPPISIGVFAARDIDQSVLNRILDEAQAIWEPAGITFDWHRIPSERGSATWQLTVTIDDQRRGFLEWQGALGWIPFTPSGPAPSIHLSRAAAEAMISGTAGVNGTILGHEILLGRALGRALSHELGHYLLRSKAHAPHGLMRATWPTDELFSIYRDGFTLTAQERAAVRQVHLSGWMNVIGDAKLTYAPDDAAVSADVAEFFVARHVQRTRSHGRWHAAMSNRFRGPRRSAVR
jgi:hypothetical protein